MMASRRIGLRLLLVFFLTGAATLSFSTPASARECFGPVCEEWVARYAGPDNARDVSADMVVDASGNVYVTGCSRDGDYLLTTCGSGGSRWCDFLTVKYDTNGVKQWDSCFNGSPLTGGSARDLTLDPYGGGVVATGHSYSSLAGSFVYTTVSFSQLGGLGGGPTSHRGDSYSVAVDAAGYSVVTGQGTYPTYDYLTVGSTWSSRYDSGGTDYAYAIATDGTNSYVTGTAGTVKYDAAGVEQWVVGPAGGDIVVDGAGNVYVTGGAGTYEYDTDGNEEWVGVAGGAIAIDGDGNTYVTGGPGGTYKYDVDGNQVWVNPLGGSYIGLDAEGNVYVTGGDFVTRKFDANGVKRWEVDYDAPTHDELVVGIGVDANGNAYVAGKSTGEDGTPDYLTIKYAPNPNPPVGGLAELPDGTSLPSAGHGVSPIGVALLAVVTGFTLLTASLRRLRGRLER